MDYDRVRMVGRAAVAARLEDEGVIAVIRLAEPAAARPVAEALLRGGVRAIELTMTMPGALRVLGELTAALPASALLGVGTVLDVTTAREAIAVGARFIVSPVFRRAVIDECHGRDVAVLPGCYTPTEIMDACEAGADLVKLFPATSLGPSFVRDLRAPLPRLKLVPTGGVTVANAAEWIRAGAAAVGLGGGLVDARAVAAGEMGVIAERAAQLVDAVRDARRSLASAGRVQAAAHGEAPGAR